MKCAIHNVEFKLIPAGVSKKSGKPYSEFYACPEKGCRETLNSNGGNSTNRGNLEGKEARIERVMGIKHDSIALAGAIRDGVLITNALIQAGAVKPMVDDIKTSINFWKDFVYGLHTEK